MSSIKYKENRAWSDGHIPAIMDELIDNHKIRGLKIIEWWVSSNNDDREKGVDVYLKIEDNTTCGVAIRMRKKYTHDTTIRSLGENGHKAEWYKMMDGSYKADYMFYAESAPDDSDFTIRRYRILDVPLLIDFIIYSDERPTIENDQVKNRNIGGKINDLSAFVPCNRLPMMNHNPDIFVYEKL